jgi:hypothetical protein
MFRYCFNLLIVSFLLLHTACTNETMKGVSASNKKYVARNLVSIATVSTWQRNGHNALFYQTGLKIDADGSPRAYHPEDLGLDFNYNGGSNGVWWGVVTNDKGQPVVQGPNDPAPGYYVSGTSLEDKSKANEDPYRYVNAEEIPYIVLPEKLYKTAQVNLGDFAAVINKSNGKMAYAIFADIGPPEKLGEGSIMLANELDINSSPKFGGADEGIIYIVFPGSGNGNPRSKEEIRSEGEILLKEWGGKELLLSFFKEKQNLASGTYNEKETGNHE